MTRADTSPKALAPYARLFSPVGTPAFPDTPRTNVGVSAFSVKVTGSDGNGRSVSDTCRISGGSLAANPGESFGATVKARDSNLRKRLRPTPNEGPQRSVLIPAAEAFRWRGAGGPQGGSPRA